MKAKDMFQDSGVRANTCEYLEVGYFTPSGQMENCSCEKHYKDLPNGMVAMMYCCQRKTHGNCWFDVAK